MMMLLRVAAVTLVAGCATIQTTAGVRVTASDLARGLTCYLEVLAVPPATQGRVRTCRDAVLELQARAGQPVDPVAAATVAGCAAQLDARAALGEVPLLGCRQLVDGLAARAVP